MVDGARRRLLIVDDEPLILEVLTEHFKSDYDVDTALNGADALGAILRVRPDVVMLDINMPRMNGIEFLREIRADPKLARTPVVVLTTSNDEQDRVEAYNLNVAGYLLKPVTFNNFVNVMAALNAYWSLVELP